MYYDVSCIYIYNHVYIIMYIYIYIHDVYYRNMEAKIDHASNPAVINSIAAIPKRNAHKSIINGKIIGKEWKRWENIGKSTIHEGFYGNITCS